MKVSIFTTQTIHHAWFIKKLSEFYPDLMCVVEKTVLSNHKPHPYEQEREKYESAYFFQSKPPLLAEIANTYLVENINQLDTIKAVNDFKTDLIIVFGTSKIKSEIIKNYDGRIINLHGGDPEFYRGLDSHLWAIYHNDFDALVTALHILNHSLDDGHIIQKQQLRLHDIISLAQLRAINTQSCLDLCLGALFSYARLGEFITSKQRTIGRYYSAMPVKLKDICYRKFQKYILTNENSIVPK